jgi:ATP-binding cassette subfamily C (CFTR/MRP) protein 4
MAAMDSWHDDSKFNPYETAGWVSRLFFLWPNQLVEDGNSKMLNQEDLPVIPREDRSSYLNKLLNDEWEKQKKLPNPSLLKALFWAFAPKYAWLALILIAESVIRIFQAILLGYFVKIMLNEDSSSSNSLLNNGYFVSFLISLCGALVAGMHHQYFFYGWKFGMQTRIAMSSIIYDKAVRLHTRSLANTESSHIINLSSQDVEAFQQAGIFIHFLYVPILEAGAILVVGIREVGISFVAGFAAVILLVPLQSVFSRALTQIRTTLGHRTDERLKLVSQAIGGARLMKINGWELAFRDIIGAARRLEMSSMMKLNYIKGINEAIFFFAPVVIGAITFITFHETGGELTAQNVFTVLTLFSIIQFSLTKFFPLAVQFQTQAYVAVSRTQKLLLLEEISDNVSGNSESLVSNSSSSSSSGPGAAAEAPAEAGVTAMISMRDFDASWEADKQNTHHKKQKKQKQQESDIEASGGSGGGEAGAEAGDVELGAAKPTHQLVLSGISLDVAAGELLVLVGPVGAAKTSLLMAMMGELASLDSQHQQGQGEGQGQGGTAPGKPRSQFRRRGSLAYCAQEPWIMSTTVKNNILFGLPFEREKYLRVLESCDLLSDLHMLSNGDETVIGDR